MLKSDITFKQVDNPDNNYCCSGHNAPDMFEDKPIRFFYVSSKNISGVYCEICLIVANAIAKEKKCHIQKI